MNTNWEQVTCVQTHDTVIERVADPLPKGRSRKEGVALTEFVQLRIPIQHPGRDELIEYTDDKRWKNGEKDIVK
jgi:hypothetical protein